MVKGSVFTIGVISDTHGAVSAGAMAALAGVDHIIHAGDIVSGEVVPALSRIAPVTAVRGNMDSAGVNGALPITAVAEVADVFIYVLHDLGVLDLDPVAGGFSAVIHGHTHVADITWRGDVLYLNPGSARPGQNPSVAKITVDGGVLSAEIVGIVSETFDPVR